MYVYYTVVAVLVLAILVAVCLSKLPRKRELDEHATLHERKAGNALFQATFSQAYSKGKAHTKWRKRPTLKQFLSWFGI